MATAVLLISCPDRTGIVHAVTGFVLSHGGNILDLEQHVDPAQGWFFMRLEWTLENFLLPREAIHDAFRHLAEHMQMDWELRFTGTPARIALFVTRDSHCFFDIMSRIECGEWHAQVPLIISNRDELRHAAERYGIPFHCIPVTSDTKQAAEEKQDALLRAAGVNLVVLARYMQVLSPWIIERWREKVINIHHSFLPAFAGAKPYHAAHSRGVKIIGATAHYVTEELDEGPIIEQDVARVSHRETVEELVRLGKDVEKIVLARAIAAHLEHRVLAWRKRTVVFS